MDKIKEEKVKNEIFRESRIYLDRKKVILKFKQFNFHLKKILVKNFSMLPMTIS